VECEDYADTLTAERIRRVIETAKQYFQDPGKFDQAVRVAMENGDGE